MHYEYISDKIFWKNCTNAWAQRRENGNKCNQITKTGKKLIKIKMGEKKKHSRRRCTEKTICVRCKMTFSLLHELLHRAI